MRETGDIPGVDLDGTSFTAEGSLVRNTYCVYDDEGELLLEAEQQLDRVPFFDADGEDVFEVSDGRVDSDYVLVPAGQETPVVLVEKDFSPLQHDWTVRGRSERVVATIEAESTVVEFLRSYVPFGGIVPATYSIKDADGMPVGELAGQFGLGDAAELTLDQRADLPHESLVAAAVAVIALDSR